MIAMAPAIPSMTTRVPMKRGEKLQFHPHRGQWRAWQSRKRFVLILAGTQSGKTSFAPYWLRREMQERGAGDYLVVAPSFPLLSAKLFPELKRLLQDECGLFRFPRSPTPDNPAILTSAGELMLFGKKQDIPTRIMFGHADNPDSLESLTAKGAILDEPGQKRFRFQSWQAIRRRLSIHGGRALLTTTPYDLGWLYQQFWIPWERSGRNHPEIDVINFRSIDNPAFPQAEYLSTQATMPMWQHMMFYDGIFTRPAGMIYDCWSDLENKIPRFTIPANWPRHMGVDFGGTNTAAVKIAQEIAPDGSLLEKYYAYAEYLEGGKIAAQHVTDLLDGEPMRPRTVGGAASEGQWRDEWSNAGLSVAAPVVTDVEVGIGRVYKGIKLRQLIVFDDLHGLLDEIHAYSRQLDVNGQPTEAIQDKRMFHRLDALRYIAIPLFGNETGFEVMPDALIATLHEMGL